MIAEHLSILKIIVDCPQKFFGLLPMHICGQHLLN